MVRWWGGRKSTLGMTDGEDESWNFAKLKEENVAGNGYTKN